MLGNFSLLYSVLNFYSSYSQTDYEFWLGKIQKGRDHLKERKFELAIENFGSPLDYAIQDMGINSPQVRSFLYYLGKADTS